MSSCGEHRRRSGKERRGKGFPCISPYLPLPSITFSYLPFPCLTSPYLPYDQSYSSHGPLLSSAQALCIHTVANELSDEFASVASKTMERIGELRNWNKGPCQASAPYAAMRHGQMLGRMYHHYMPPDGFNFELKNTKSHSRTTPSSPTTTWTSLSTPSWRRRWSRWARGRSSPLKNAHQFIHFDEFIVHCGDQS